MLVRYVPGLNPSFAVAIRNPPATPSTSATSTSSGKASSPASRRGATRYFIGSVPSVRSASIWSVTRMVPSSAAIAAPMRPATISPASTGASSRTTEMSTMLAIALVAP